MYAVRFTSYTLALVVVALNGHAPTTAAPVPKDKELTTPFVVWKYTGMHKEFTSPIICGDAVVVGTGEGVLRAFRGRDGEELWQYKHGKRIYHRPSTDGDRVYFTSEVGVVAVSADKGEEVWNVAITHGGGPTLADAKLGLVFVAGDDGNLYALDAKTGAEKWKADFVTDAPPDRPGFAGANARVGNTLARPNALSSDGETVFLSAYDQSRVVAFDTKTGKQKWSCQTGGYVFASAEFTKTQAFIGSYDKCLHCLDIKTGKPAWKFETKDNISSAAVCDESSVFIPSCDGSLYAVLQKDGKKLWRFEVDKHADGKASAIYSTPILHRGALHFAAGEGQFYAVNKADGKLKWKLRPSEGSQMYCDPAFDGVRFFVTCRPKGQVVGQPPPENPGEAALIAIGMK